MPTDKANILVIAEAVCGDTNLLHLTRLVHRLLCLFGCLMRLLCGTITAAASFGGALEFGQRHAALFDVVLFRVALIVLQVLHDARLVLALAVEVDVLQRARYLTVAAQERTDFLDEVRRLEEQLRFGHWLPELHRLRHFERLKVRIAFR